MHQSIFFRYTIATGVYIHFVMDRGRGNFWPAGLGCLGVFSHINSFLTVACEHFLPITYR